MMLEPLTHGNDEKCQGELIRVIEESQVIL